MIQKTIQFTADGHEGHYAAEAPIDIINDLDNKINVRNMKYKYYAILLETGDINVQPYYKYPGFVPKGYSQRLACCQIHVSTQKQAVLRYNKFSGPNGLHPTETMNRWVLKEFQMPKGYFRD